MNINCKLYNSAFKHIKEKDLPEEGRLNLKVLKGEKFAFQIAITTDKSNLVSLGSYNHIGYRGLQKRVRVDLEKREGLDIKGSFLGYVLDDDSKTLIADPILKKEYLYSEANKPTIIWVEGKIDKNYIGDNIDITINLLSQEGYAGEVVEEIINLNVDIIDVVLPELKEGNFHLDLWQHLSSWARTYEVPFWGDEHFEIIDNFMKELASLGEKVITVVASDFTWEGQGCFQVEENSSNLFEHNIIKVKRNIKGNIECDFTALEKYLNICFEHGIEEEIDIFGLIASWQRTDFGNPLKDYDDPVRVSYLCEKDESYNYIDNKKELGEYIGQVINFFKEKKLMDRVRIISDMPKNPDSFKEWSEFLNESSGEKLLLKTALHEESFAEGLDGFSDVTLSMPLLLKTKDRLEEIRERISGKLGWYVCWFPEKLNHFIGSPLIESRLTGWYSYYMGLDGFLRWDYALWTGKPFDNISYKYPRWKAGDMFFVYPGKDMKPLRSIRWENLRFGLQDQAVLKMAEDKVGKKRVQGMLVEALGSKDEMRTTGEFSVEMNYSTQYEEYMLIRDQIIKIIEKG